MSDLKQIDRIKLAQRTIAMLSSMINSGENHTARSNEMKNNAIQGLDELANEQLESTGQALPIQNIIGCFLTQQSEKYCVDLDDILVGIIGGELTVQSYNEGRNEVWKTYGTVDIK